MSVTKELLQMDLYKLLGIEEKAAEKEVRMVTRRSREVWRPFPSWLLGWHRLSRFGRAVGQ